MQRDPKIMPQQEVLVVLKSSWRPGAQYTNATMMSVANENVASVASFHSSRIMKFPSCKPVSIYSNVYFGILVDEPKI